MLMSAFLPDPPFLLPVQLLLLCSTRNISIHTSPIGNVSYFSNDVDASVNTIIRNCCWREDKWGDALQRISLYHRHNVSHAIAEKMASFFVGEICMIFES